MSKGLHTHLICRLAIQRWLAAHGMRFTILLSNGVLLWCAAVELYEQMLLASHIIARFKCHLDWLLLDPMLFCRSIIINEQACLHADHSRGCTEGPAAVL